MLLPRLCLAAFLITVLPACTPVTPGPAEPPRVQERTLPEIQLRFDKEKGKFYKLFTSKNITDDGLIRLAFSISPAGQVIDCHVASSTFANPDLESGIVDLVRGMSFEARDVPTFSLPAYPIRNMPQ